MQRSKIDVTDELRRLGVWEEASLFKDLCRQRYRASGLSRREANEFAWEEMAEYFDGQNLERYLSTWFPVASNFPPLIEPSCADQADEAPFDSVWRLWCLCLARLECWERDDFEAAALMSMEMFDKASIELTHLSLMAIYEVNRFVVKIAAPKFVAVVDRLKAASEPQQEYIEELNGHLCEMGRFGFENQRNDLDKSPASCAREPRSRQNAQRS
jgi:hypothetical protein